MTYRLVFSKKALKEWDGLDSSVRRQFEKVLARRLEEPHVPAARLRGPRHRYKIKLKGVGYRLLYEVHEAEIVVLVLGIGRRDSIYDAV